MSQPRNKRRMLCIVALLLAALGLVAACGDDDAGDSAQSLEPTGPGCSSVPAEGEGSFDDMAGDPAVTAATGNPLLARVVEALGDTGLADMVNGDGPFTIFAPADSAFDAFDERELAAVLDDVEVLRAVLTHHVVEGERLSSSALIDEGTVTTAYGDTLEITDDNGLLVVDGASTVCMDISTANATLHVIDEVLFIDQ